MFGLNLSDVGDAFNTGIDKYLQYEAIQQGADFGGTTQQPLAQTPQVPQQVIPVTNPTQPAQMNMMPVYIGGAVVGLIGLVLLIKD